jgi:ABC-2 type transport system permease protein
MTIATIKAIAIVETKRLIRARMALMLLLIVPVFQIILFGYAIKPGNATLRISVAAPTRQGAHEVVEAMRRIPSVMVIDRVGATGAAEAAVRSGRASIGIEVPRIRSFADPTASGGPIRVIVDATDPLLTMAAVARIESAYNAERVARSDMADAGPGLRIERLFNPDARSDWTYAPALAGVTVMIAMVMLGSIGIAREREGGSWETFRSLPIAPMHLIAGKLAPHILIGTAQGLLVLFTGHLLFDLPIPVATTALIFLLPLFATAHYLIGFVISARAATQLAALQGAVAFYLPAMLLSGFLYPFDTLPRWAQIIGNIFPLSHFIRAAHDAVLRERDFLTVLGHGLPMLAFTFAAMLLAQRVCRNQTSGL